MSEKSERTKPGVMIYFDDFAPMDKILTDEQLGRYIRALVHYSKDGELVDFSDEPVLQMAFMSSKPKIDRDDETYNRKKLHGQYMAYVRVARENGESYLSERDWIDQLSATNSNYQLQDVANGNCTQPITMAIPVTMASAIASTVTPATALKQNINVHSPLANGQRAAYPPPFSKKELNEMTTFVDQYINELYPQHTGHEHQTVAKSKYKSFARKLLDCAKELDLTAGKIQAVVETALDEEEHGDMTIFLATTPEQLSYWLVRTGTRDVVELRRTSYDYEQLVANRG